MAMDPVDIVLIPGFWLDGRSWDDVAAPLRAAGHRVHALTLPGLESPDADRRHIGLRDHVDAVIAVVDSITGPVVLVGHSGGGAIAHATVDARPERIARVVYVDSWPSGDGEVINDELPVVDGEIPLPDWSVFEAPDLVDLDDDLRARFRAMARPEPAGVAMQPQALSDERRYGVPATLIACEFTAAQLHGWMDGGGLRELARLRDMEVVELPTGHWPQLTRPTDLAATILAALDR